MKTGRMDWGHLLQFGVLGVWDSCVCCIESVTGSITRTLAVFACMQRRVLWSTFIIALSTWAGQIARWFRKVHRMEERFFAGVQFAQ